MNVNKGPREWWIVPPEYHHKDVLTVSDFKPAHPDFTHVIEYSAFEALQRELADARKEPVAFRPPKDDKEIFDLMREKLTTANARIVELEETLVHIDMFHKDRIERLEAALRIIASHDLAYAQYTDIAREALKPSRAK